MSFDSSFVGVCTICEIAKHTRVWHEPVELVPAELVRALQRAGLRVVMLPYDPDTAYAEMLEGLDGLVVLQRTHGSDIPPADEDCSRMYSQDGSFGSALAGHARRRAIPTIIVPLDLPEEERNRRIRRLVREIAASR
jgi:hypothetical protein